MDQQQPADMSVMPPTDAAAPHPYAASAAAAPMENNTPFGWVKTPKGILRMVEWLLTVIMFATMAAVDNFEKYSDFKFMVAAGVLCWLYVTFLMLVYIFRARIEQWCTFLPPIELVLDGVCVIFCLAAGASSADRCNHKLSGLDGTQYEGETICKNSFIKTSVKNNLNASIVFAFFSMVAFMASFFFSWKDNAKEEAKR